MKGGYGRAIGDSAAWKAVFETCNTGGRRKRQPSLAQTRMQLYGRLAEVRDHLRRYIGSDLISIEQDRKYSEEALYDSEESATRKLPDWLVRNVIYVPFPQRESLEWNDQGQA